MTRETIARSLDAAEQALSHFSASLERGGFAAGAPAYRRMAEVLLAQAMTLHEAGETEFDERLRRVAALARDVHRQLHPHVAAMETLLALERIAPPAPAPAPPAEGPAGRILEALAAAEAPLSMTALRARTGDGSRAVRGALEALAESGRVERAGSASRPRYRLSRR